MRAKRTYDSRESRSQQCRDALRFGNETRGQRERGKARPREYHRRRLNAAHTERDALPARLDSDLRTFVAGG